MPQEWILPSYHCHFEGPDLFFIKVTAEKEVDVESVKGLYALTPEVRQKADFVYFLMDLGTGAMPSKEAREAMPRLYKDPKPFGLVFYGGTFASRAVAAMVLRGLALIGRIKAEATFAKTKDDALEWVRRHRAKRAESASSSRLGR